MRISQVFYEKFYITDPDKYFTYLTTELHRLSGYWIMRIMEKLVTNLV